MRGEVLAIAVLVLVVGLAGGAFMFLKQQAAQAAESSALSEQAQRVAEGRAGPDPIVNGNLTLPRGTVKVGDTVRLSHGNSATGPNGEVVLWDSAESVLSTSGKKAGAYGDGISARIIGVQYANHGGSGLRPSAIQVRIGTVEGWVAPGLILP